VAASLSLAVMFWPYMIPYTITVGNAAAPKSRSPYALLGAGWLTLKSEGELRDRAWRRVPWLVGAVLAVLGIAVGAAYTIPVSTGSGSHPFEGTPSHYSRLQGW
jgi:cytochrome bd-type quinol oxidase subunit 2